MRMPELLWTPLVAVKVEARERGVEREREAERKREVEGPS